MILKTGRLNLWEQQPPERRLPLEVGTGLGRWMGVSENDAIALYLDKVSSCTGWLLFCSTLEICANFAFHCKFYPKEKKNHLMICMLKYGGKFSSVYSFL